jgi:hypothetical protein
VKIPQIKSSIYKCALLRSSNAAQVPHGFCASDHMGFSFSVFFFFFWLFGFFWFCLFGNTGVWIQDLVLARKVFYLLRPLCNPLCHMDSHNPLLVFCNSLQKLIKLKKAFTYIYKLIIRNSITETGKQPDKDICEKEVWTFPRAFRSCKSHGVEVHHPPGPWDVHPSTVHPFPCSGIFMGASSHGHTGLLTWLSAPLPSTKDGGWPWKF